MVLASGTNASLRYCREATINTTPTGIGTAVDSVGATADGGGSGLSKFTRGSGSFVTDGYVAGQKVRTAGFSNSANNGDWIISSVAALELVVVDASDVIVDETGDAGNTLRIVLSTLRATGRNINLEKNVLESEEVDPDGIKSELRHGFNRVVGSPGFELSREAYDDFLEFALGDLWYTVAVTGSPDLGVTASTKKFTRSAGSFITDGFRPGDIIRTSSFSNTANNGDWRVTAVTATELTVVEPTGVTLTDETEASGKSLTFPGKRLDLISTILPFLVERQFSDVTQYQLYNGCAVDQWQLNVQPEAIIGGSFNIIGMSAAAIVSSSVSSVAASAAATNSPFAAFDGAIFEGALAIAVATSVEMTLARNRSLNPVIGSKFSPDVFGGQANITGNLLAYFENATLLNKFVNETESSIWFRFDDPNSSTDFMSIVLPRVKYTGGSMDPPQEGPISMEMPFEALKASTLSKPGGATINTSLTIQRSNS